MIFCLEDDRGIRELIIYTLHNTGFEALGFSQPRDFWQALSEKKPHLILLDIMLPGEDGIAILKKLRQHSLYKKLPIILITAKGTEYDKVLGLDSGADDYLVKPFGMMELISRVKALLRRTQGDQEVDKWQYGNVILDKKAHQVTVANQAIDLTPKEFELLKLLLINVGIVVTREEMLTKIWGYDFVGETRTVDVHIKSLRQKLGSEGSIIETIRSVGYKIGDRKSVV